MKKVVLNAVVIVLFSLFTGCSDDDAVADAVHQPVETAILGKWYPQGGTINGGAFQPYENNDCNTQKDYQEFVGGTVKFVGYDEACSIDETSVNNYTIVNNTLIVENEVFDDSEFTITSLTSQQLILTSTYNTPGGMEIQAAYFSRQ